MSKSFAVIGLGRFGRCVAMELSDLGADVLAIDSDEDKINSVADYVTCAINIDVCDVDALKNAGISNMDAVIVSMGDCLESSIMSVITAKELGVPLVIAKARDEVTGNIISKVGADRIVFPERESGIRLSHRLMSADVLDYFDLSDTVSMVKILPKSEWVGKSLVELNLRKEYRINIVGIWDNDKINVSIDPKEPLSSDKPLLVIVAKNDLKRLS